MKKTAADKSITADVIPLYGRDEMNLIEFPFGPVTAMGQKTFEVEHPVYDKTLKREVTRKLLITGSDAFGLPRPIDDQVLMGMKALTYEAGFKSREVKFSRYQLCRIIGWPTDGRAYQRLEAAFDRIAGTTLKFKQSWWDKGESVWKTKTFHLIEDVELCSRDQIERARLLNQSPQKQLCSFVWGDVIWKSFEDGFIKKVDLEMFRRISKGRRREIPLRLYRILDKRFYRQQHVTFEIRKLCLGKLGMNADYAPSQMLRILQRSADWLTECGFLRQMTTRCGREGTTEVVFTKASAVLNKSTTKAKRKTEVIPRNQPLEWFACQQAERQLRIETKAVCYCQQTNPEIFKGYHRNRAQRGEAFERYREMAIEAYLRSKIKPKSTVA